MLGSGSKVGETRTAGSIGGEKLRSFLEELLGDLQALEIMIERDQFDRVRRIGAEQEMFLIDEDWRPARMALPMLRRLDDPQFTTELAQFNLELNLEPVELRGAPFRALEDQLSQRLARARQVARELDTRVALVGVLPTLRKSDLGLDSMTPLDRYRTLDRVTTRMRGGPYELRIVGIDELNLRHDNVMLESCTASFQVHLQSAPDEFANLYNCAQMATSAVLAAACFSPYLFGRRLWRETRIALFQQAVDTRAATDHLRDRRPRVDFGRRWLQSSVLELFKEDVARFRVLLGLPDREDALADLAAGNIPRLRALCLHNGTVWRWNRACYGVSDGRPHLRIENRVLPSGPTVVDEVANAALWIGLVLGLDQRHPNIREELEFSVAKGNFERACRSGLDSQLEWFDGKLRPAGELLGGELLEVAREGLVRSEVDPDEADRLLDVIRHRVENRTSGSEWMIRSMRALSGRARITEKLGDVTAALVHRQEEGRPVSTWELAQPGESGGWQHNFRRVEQYMTTDLFTVTGEEPLRLVLQMMNWLRIRHVPVEDGQGHLIGMVSYRTMLRVLGEPEGHALLAQPVTRFMKTRLVTVHPTDTTRHVLALMKERAIAAVPVVRDGRLIGIVTERDFMDLSRDLLEARLEAT